MSDGLLLQPDHVRRLNAALQWHEQRRAALEFLLSRGPQTFGQMLRSGAGLPFELYDDCTPGGTGVYAWPMLTDLSGPDTSGDKVLLADALLGDVRAYGSTHTGFTVGARGLYQKIGDVNVIIACQRLAKICRGTTTAAIAKTDPITVDTVIQLDDGQDPVAGDDETVLTVANWAEWESKTANDCQFVADGSGGWRFDQGACKADQS